MKKLFLVLVTAAITLSFLPTANAADNAVLGLSVTFAVDQDLERVKEISIELDNLADKAAYVFEAARDSGDPDVIKAAIDQLIGYVDYIEQTLFAELYEIEKRRPDLQDIVREVVQKGMNIQDKIGVYIEELKGILSTLKIGTSPEGPFKVKVGEKLEFKVIGEDPLGRGPALNSKVPIGVQQTKIERSANFAIDLVEWTPTEDDVKGDEPTILLFEVYVGLDDGTAIEASETISVEVYVIDRVISIEIYPLDWSLKDVKLGELRPNNDVMAQPIHNIANTGNVAVLVDIGYGPYLASGVVPGLRQGLDTFVTGLGGTATGDQVDNPIPPSERLKVGIVKPNEKMPLGLMYGAPTALSPEIQSHGVQYELRAYLVINGR